MVAKTNRANKKVYTFIIPGEPVPKSRPRTVTKKGKTWTFTPAKTLAAEKVVATYTREQIKKPLEGDVQLAIKFYCKYPRKRADIDNLTKLVMDGLNKVAFIDDKQVVRLRVELPTNRDVVFDCPKVREENPRTEITIKELG